jgi:hypothetical protein
VQGVQVYCSVHCTLWCSLGVRIVRSVRTAQSHSFVSRVSYVSSFCLVIQVIQMIQGLSSCPNCTVTLLVDKWTKWGISVHFTHFIISVLQCEMVEYMKWVCPTVQVYSNIIWWTNGQNKYLRHCEARSNLTK